MSSLESWKTAKYISAIERAGSISAAADELGITQPALSAALKKAEQSLKAAIIDRSSSPLVLTEAGRIYLSFARDVADRKRELMRKVSDIEDLRCGSLTVGGVGTFNAAYLPRAVAVFAESYPGIDIRIVDGTAPEIARSALEGHVDVFVSPLPCNAMAFDCSMLMRERIFLCVPLDWSVVQDFPPIGQDGFARIGRDEFELLKGCSFVTMSHDQVVGRKLESLFELYNVHPGKTVQANQMSTCLALTLEGVGVSLATESALQYAGLKDRLALYLPDEDICVRELYVITPKNRSATQAVKRFSEVLKGEIDSSAMPGVSSCLHCLH